MNTRLEGLVRLEQLLQVVAKENNLLQSVRKRLLPPGAVPTKEWLEALLQDPDATDRLEAFASRFSRMQDTIIDKVIPVLFRVAGEIPGTAIDNLNRAERLGFITNTNEWIAMRRLRNRLVHEYIEETAEMLPAVVQADAFSDELRKAFEALSTYARDHLGTRV